MEEIWKPIAYEGYEVSNLGRWKTMVFKMMFVFYLCKYKNCRIKSL